MTATVTNISSTSYQGPTSWKVIIQPGPNNNYAGNAALTIYQTSSDSESFGSTTFFDGNNTWGPVTATSGGYTLSFDWAKWYPPYTTGSGTVNGTIQVQNLIIKQDDHTVETFSGILFEWDTSGTFLVPAYG
ncbi:hypothetical protein [Azospirillum soli]|uniref:hypothetical protein n=1 Tax=Azospirillum soli TaxID=1304799 RepID=UPI001AEB49FF|nr:hypothetical protein [Azospirillum soli]MBP2312922.1 hypothetical protein [Azospirillum soli]